jgi:FMN phosphatase YigB (HAD superfamily)
VTPSPGNRPFHRGAIILDRTERPSRALLSCDVFETALARGVGSPTGLFLILGQRLTRQGLLRHSPEVFARTRHEANRHARINAGRGMGLSDIYQELQFALGLTDGERDRIQAEELALEADLLSPIPATVRRIRLARESGMAVAFVSDMYLGSAFIREQLERHGLCAAGDGCYVSCELGFGKEDGRAFRALSETEGIALGHVLHRGNDMRSDIRAARAAGAGAEPFLEGNLNRYEQILDGHAYATAGLASAFAGASRLARLSIEVDEERKAHVRDVAASVGGPVLSGYILWLLLRARDNGVRHLYCLPPHGDILARIARILIGKLDLECEAHLGAEGIQADPQGVAVALGPTAADLFKLKISPHSPGRQDPAAFLFSRARDEDWHLFADPARIQPYFADHLIGRGHQGAQEDRFLAVVLGGPDPELVRRTVLSFTEHLWLEPASLDLGVDLRAALSAVMEAFLREPSAAEARAWGMSTVRSRGWIQGVRGRMRSSVRWVYRWTQRIRHRFPLGRP